MVHRLSTQAGKALYKMRKQTVDPVPGIIKHVTRARVLLDQVVQIEPLDHFHNQTCQVIIR